MGKNVPKKPQTGTSASLHVRNRGLLLGSGSFCFGNPVSALLMLHLQTQGGGTLNSAKSPFAGGRPGIKNDPFCRPLLPQAGVFTPLADGLNDARGRFILFPPSI